jgi:hypothetical protein
MHFLSSRLSLGEIFQHPVCYKSLVIIPMVYQQRVIIKFLAKDGLCAGEIEEKLRPQFTEDADSLGTAQFCIAEVKRGRQGLHDELSLE